MAGGIQMTLREFLASNKSDCKIYYKGKQITKDFKQYLDNEVIVDPYLDIDGYDDDGPIVREIMFVEIKE